MKYHKCDVSHSVKSMLHYRLNEQLEAYPISYGGKADGGCHSNHAHKLNMQIVADGSTLCVASVVTLVKVNACRSVAKVVTYMRKYSVCSQFGYNHKANCVIERSHSGYKLFDDPALPMLLLP